MPLVHVEQVPCEPDWRWGLKFDGFQAGLRVDSDPDWRNCS
jgi:hypothetical protein